MAILVKDIVRDVQLAFENANPVIVLDCINTIHRGLCYELPVIRDTVTVSLTSGTREYALDETTASIMCATYYPDASGAYEILEPVDMGDLDREDRAWRQIPDGTPKGFYIFGGYIGFVPAPDTTTASGYPKVELEVTEFSTLAMGDSLPTSIKTKEVYVHGARMLYAQFVDINMVQGFEAMYRYHLQDTERAMGRRNRNHRRIANPEMMYTQVQI